MGIKRNIAEIVNQVLEPLGARLVRFRETNRAADFPYVQAFKLGNHEFSLWIADETAEEWFNAGFHEHLPENEEMACLVRPGDRVLEIGAHHGFYTMLLARIVGPQGKVHAVEASPYNTMVLAAQITLNGVGNICTLQNAAASDSNGRLTLTRETNAHVTAPQEEGFSVEAVPGDALDEQFGPFNVLKVDVEGFEGRVLAGCQRILARAPKLALEIHSTSVVRYGDTAASVLQQIAPERYAGIMISREDPYRVLPFECAEIEKHTIVNLFLKPQTNA